MTNNIDLSVIYRTMFFLMMVIMITSISGDALAVDENDVLGNSLCRIVMSLSGGIAKAVATVAIIGVAGGLLMGKFQWMTALTVSVGVIIIFSAGKMVSWISGDATAECTTE